MRFLKRVALLGIGLVALAAIALFVGYLRSDNACTSHVSPRGELMKAIVYCDYGAPDVLKLEDTEKPAAGDDQVLVRVHAASVNPADWHSMRGTPVVMRLDAGLRRPKVIRLGVDFAGTIESVGRNVKRFRPGDEVFGGRTGAFAQYLTVREDRAVVPKPSNVTFEEAAAVPIAAITALQAVRDHAKVEPGQKVLINGASGGVGTFAVQIAKSYGAEVTGVCSTKNAEMVRSIGADRVVDYTKEDFTKSPQRYDAILDAVGNRSLSEFRSVLNPKGRYVMIGGPSGRFLDPLPRMLFAWIFSRFVSQHMGSFLADLNAKDLAVLGDLLQSGKLKPVIDKRYDLRQASEAIRYLEAGHARGKVVIAIP